MLLLSGLFRRRRLAKDRVDQSLRARQRDHSDAQSAALGTWQHASADNLKNSFACRCYGCTGAGRLFAGKSSRGGVLSSTISTADPTLRRGWLDHVLIVGEQHPRRMLASYSSYYNESRAHLALEKDAPLRRAIQRCGAIITTPILSGLHHRYVRI